MQTDPSPTDTLASRADLPKNEVHDCQRLIIRRASLRDRLADRATIGLGPLVAILISTDSVTDARFSPGSAGAGKVVAEIVNYDNTPYEPLGIRPGLNCLWLRPGKSPEGTDWRAEIRQPPRDRHCGVAPAASAALQVRRLVHNDTLYPVTGRWMWDMRNREQFLGIRCGAVWCEIGRSGFNGTARLTDVASVPGWFDEQVLSIKPTGFAFVVLSGVKGRITPAPGLETVQYGGVQRLRSAVDLSGASVNSDSGIMVARAVLSGADQPGLQAYREKYPSTVASGFQLYFSKATGSPRMRSDNGPWRPVTGSKHSHSGPGTVRWAWSDHDERTWIPCEEGCCTTGDS